MTKEFLQSIKIIALGLVLAFGINYAMAGPNATPPDSNTLPPITVGATQYKEGGLSIGKKTNPAVGGAWQFLYPYKVPTLDIAGDTNIAGSLNIKNYLSAFGLSIKGWASIIPSSGDSTSDNELFQVFDHTFYNFASDSLVFSVDTRTDTSKGLKPGIFTKRLTASEDSIFEKRLDVGNDIWVGRDIYVGHDVSIVDDLSVSKNATIYKKSAVGSTLAVGTITQSDTFNLLLDGTTNIGTQINKYGKTGMCTMKKTEMVNNNKSCPPGTYLSSIDIGASDTGTDMYARCNDFSTRSQYDGGSCY